MSEQIKNAWLCSSWRNNECPHSLPVTFGNSRDSLEEGNESKKERVYIAVYSGKQNMRGKMRKKEENSAPQ